MKTRLLAIGSLLLPLIAGADIIRVDSTASHPDPDGTSWSSAFRYLQDALAVSSPGDEIWVVAGTYFPDEGGGQTDGSTNSRFTLAYSVSIYGGFTGSELLRNERDPAANVTILSGDLSQDDVDPDADQITALATDILGANARVVLETTGSYSGGQIDGFVITAGASTSSGGGFIGARRSFIVSNCSFRGNRAATGGAAYISGSSSIVSNCLFSGNSATSDGGALWIDMDSEYSNCLFVANSAGRYGGAIFCRSGSPIIGNCTMTGNSALAGGALFTSYGTPAIRNSILWNNRASGSTSTPSASSAYYQSYRPTFAHSIVANSGNPVWNNQIGQNYGGNLASDPDFLLAPAIGQLPLFPEALTPLPGSPAIDSGNMSLLSSDAADLDHDGDTFEPLPLDLGNSLRTRGSGVDRGAFEAGAGPAIVAAPTPLLLAPNSGSQAAALDLSTVFDISATSYAVVISRPDHLAAIDLNPLTGVVNITPQPDAIGSQQVIFGATNAAGETNYVSVVIEIFPDVIHVDAGAGGAGNGLSWAGAFRHLQDAIVLGGSRHQIWVAQGVYRPDTGSGRTSGDPSAKFVLPAGVSLLGGFQGTESDPDERNLDLRSILSGDVDRNDTDPDANSIAESTADVVGSNSKTLLEVIDAPASARIENLLITAAGSTNATGGGMRVVGSNATIRRCDFSGNKAGSGGGVSIESSSAVIADCRFSFNSAYPRGGALWSDNGTLDVVGCTFEGNSVLSNSGTGGAISVKNTTGSCRDSTFTGNQAIATFGKGGAAYSATSSFPFIRCTFTSNSAYEGGACFMDGGSVGELWLCKLNGNSASRYGGAIYTDEVDTSLNNCELHGNTSNSDGGAIYNYGAVIEIINSSLTGNAAGATGGAIYNRTWSTADPAAALLTNSIIWENLSWGASDTARASVGDVSTGHYSTYSHCLIANSGGSTNWNPELGTDLGGNIDIDPEFLIPSNPAIAPMTTADLRVQTFSPVIDAGNTAGLPADSQDIDGDNNLTETLPLDLSAKPRIASTAVDMGAFENQSGPALVQAAPRLRLEPMSGNHPALFDLTSLFDSSALGFAVDAVVPGHILTASADPLTGIVDIHVLPNQFGPVTLVVSAGNAAGGTSFHAISIDVFPTAFRVDAGATGLATGLTWTDAFPDLQSALAVPRIEGLPFEIWVAEGVYHPDDGPGQTADDPASSFALVPDCFLYGGFAGNEALRQQRNTVAHPAVLSGDLAQDDINVDGNHIAETTADLVGINATCIITCNPGLTGSGLDGFKITAGNSMAKSTSGGALTASSSSIAMRQCTFQGNQAVLGGAVRLIDSEVDITYCHFKANRAVAALSHTIVSGGAIYGKNSTMHVNSSRFESNQAGGIGSAGGGGAAINAWGGGQLQLADTEFVANVSFGGAVVIGDNIQFSIVSSCFDGNQEGAALQLNNTPASIRGAEFLRNSSGAIKLGGESPFTCTNASFRGNSSSSDGGAVSCSGFASRRFTNCLFTGNVTSTNGGAVSSSTRDMIFSQCTFAANRAARAGGAFYYPFTSGAPSPVFRNSIFWGNWASGSLIAASSTIDSQPNSAIPATFVSCLVVGSGGSAQWDSDFGVDGGGNIDADPLFASWVPAPTAPNPGGDYRLQAGSPAIDAGLAGNLPTDETDLDFDGNVTEALPLDRLGNPRTVGAAPDLGAYETASGPGVVAAHPRVDLNPDSGTRAALLSLADVFDVSATSFQLTGIHPPNGVSLDVDSATGIVDVTVQPATVGHFVAIFEAADSSGQSSLHSIILDVFPDVVFVDDSATGSGSGLSWGDAIPQLQDALALGGQGYEIWVAEGIYLPDAGGDQSNDDPESTFMLYTGVALYGGFAGTESTRNPRDPAAHRSILSGDLALDDMNGDGNWLAESAADHLGTNAKTVVTASNAPAGSVLDGFWITAGNGGTTIDYWGHGGGLFSSGGVPVIRGCHFVGNRASSGGGIALIDAGPIQFEDCEWSGNSGDSVGGAIYLDSATAGFRGCAFSDNQSIWGGALHAADSNLNLDSSTFHANIGERGGAIYLNKGTTTVLNCVLHGNLAQSGGAIENFAEDFTALHCTFTENTAREYSGAVANSDPFPDDYPASYTHCIFWNNRVRHRIDQASASSGTYSGSQSNAIFNSCLIANSGGSTAWNSAIGIDGGGNIDADPRFLAAGNPANPLDNALAFQLQTGSPAINASSASTVTSDILGRSRPGGFAADIGAFESPAGGPEVVASPAPVRLAPNTGLHPAAFDASGIFGPSAVSFEITAVIPDHILTASISPVNGVIDLQLEPDRFGRTQIAVLATDSGGGQSLASLVVDVVPTRLYVNHAATGTASGLTWSDAFPTLQHALSNLVDGFEIWVAKGTYAPYEGPGFLNTGRDANFQLRSGIGIHGGFGGQESTLSQRDPSLHPTILTGGLGTVESPRTYQVVTATGVGLSAVLDGFTVTKGQGGTASGGIGARYGGGITIDDASPRISNCTFQNNHSPWSFGGAAAIRNVSSPVFRNCRFLGCSSYYGYGGAVGIDGPATSEFTNCTFQGNQSYSGGALSSRGSAATSIINCSFSGNQARADGGALRNESYLFLANSIIWNNRSDNSSSPTTVSPKSSISQTTGATTLASHCLIANSGGSIAWNVDLGTDVGFNLDVDPVFLVPADPVSAPNSTGDLQLGFASPALDAGDNSHVVETTDILGAPRITNAMVDLGAYEGQNDQLDTDGDKLSDAFEMAATSPPSRTGLAPDDDLDFDGLSNQAEFAFGLDPRVSDAGRWPSMTFIESGGSSYLGISYPSSVWARIFLQTHVQRSTDLGQLDDWSTGETTRVQTETLRPGVEVITERSNDPLGSHPREFLRSSIHPVP